jgi:hypothetical protein
MKLKEPNEIKSMEDMKEKLNKDIKILKKIKLKFWKLKYQ